MPAVVPACAPLTKTKVSVPPVIVTAAGAWLVLFLTMRCSLVNAEFDSFNGFALLALEMHVVVAQFELGEFPLQGGRFDAEIAQCADGHVAADAGKTL